MGGLKTGWWFPAALAGCTLGLSGCASRTFHFGFDTDGGTGTGTGGGDDPTSTGGDPTDPTVNPTDPTSNPTDPTSDPTDPTSDPTDPTSIPGGPPQLIAVRFLDNLNLELSFSEPMASVGAVDPSIFRLSMGFGYVDYDESPRTFYQEVGYANQNPYCYDGEYCYERCGYGDSGGYGDTGDDCYYDCYCDYTTTFVRVVDIRNDSVDAAKIVLSLNVGVTGRVCEALSGVPPEYTTGLFMHYTDDRPPLPSDTEGQGLYPIAEDWALSAEEGFVEVEGFFPQLNPMLPIPCPF